MPTDIRYLSAGDDVSGFIAVVPVGSIEQHCEFPVGLDCIIAERLAWLACGRLEEKHGYRCAVAPAICYGFSPEWSRSPGTISLPSRVFTDLLKTIISGLANWGFRRLVVLNAHGGNSGLIEAAAQEVVQELGGVIVAKIDYWRIAGVDIGHASEVEASIARELGIELESRPGECVEAHRGSSGYYSAYTRDPGVLQHIASEGSVSLKELIEALADTLAEIARLDPSKHYVG